MHVTGHDHWPKSGWAREALAEVVWKCVAEGIQQHTMAHFDFIGLPVNFGIKPGCLVPNTEILHSQPLHLEHTL
jgi:hypothetical protein